MNNGHKYARSSSHAGYEGERVKIYHRSVLCTTCPRPISFMNGKTLVPRKEFKISILGQSSQISFQAMKTLVPRKGYKTKKEKMPCPRGQFGNSESKLTAL